MLKKLSIVVSCIALLNSCSPEAPEQAEQSGEGKQIQVSDVAKVQDPTSKIPDQTRLAIIGNLMSVYTCTGMFVAGREEEDFLAVDLDVWTSGAVSKAERDSFQINIDRANKAVHVSRDGVDISTSVYREGLGCAIAFEDYPADKLRQDKIRPLAPYSSAEKNQVWPAGERVELDKANPDIDRAALMGALEFAFRPAEAGELDPRTRAVIVVYKGEIVAERYAPGYSSDSLHYGASMSKSLLNAVVGMRIKDGRLALKKDHLLPEWQEDNDPRSKLNLDHLLRMSSGLEFKGNHYPLDADGNLLLFMSADMGGFAASKPLEFPIDTKFKYNCGTTNIISKVLRNTFDGDDQSYWTYPTERLFKKLGMRHTLFQTDSSGTFVGSSYVWGSARDFARLGLLYLRNGNWNGEQLWPEDWVAYSTTPSTTLLEGVSKDKPFGYGAQIWLDTPFQEGVPAARFMMSGWAGQTVYMVPEKDLVIVRMGMTKPGSDVWDFKEFSTLVEAAFPASDKKVHGEKQ
ncbi:serine hydrolase domain-containing protein [Emcibacter sp.]|uniref:serine hydrolase domain-containing protein n=1 Tax=Emcibacter sp. TaxID=1979954 RepID=UPI003A8D80AE